jgi:hypothetical protein
MLSTFANAIIEGRASRTEGAFDEKPVTLAAPSEVDAEPLAAEDEEPADSLDDEELTPHDDE